MLAATLFAPVRPLNNMTRNIVVLLLVTSLTCSTKAQSVFFKSYEVETVSEFKRISDIVLTYDSAFVIACESFDSTSLLPTLELLKINSLGQFMWRQTFQFPEHAFFIQVVQTPDSGLIVTATTNYLDTIPKIAMIKTDRFGTKQWVKLLGDSNLTQQNFSLAIRGNTVFVLSRGGVKLGGGQYENCYFIASTDLNGNLNWYKKFNWQRYPFPKAMTISSNKEIFVAAEILPGGGHQFALSKIDSNGNVMWNKVYNPLSSIDAFDMKLDSASNLIITGRTGVINPSCWDIFLMKIDTAGNFIWGKTFGPSLRESWNEGFVVFQNQNGYMICAEPEFFGNKSRAALIQTDYNGNLQWMKIYGDTTGSFPNGALQLNDGYVIYGIKGSFNDNAPIYLIKTNLNGETTCKWESVTLPDSSFTISPSDTGTSGNVQGVMTYDYTELVNTSTETDECETTSVLFIPSYSFSIQTIPNPFRNEFTLTIQKQNLNQLSLTIQNVLGQTVFNEQAISTTSKTVSLQGQPNGMYFLDLTIDGERIVKKVVKQ